MWFWFAVIALICWSGSDLFSKLGCRDSGDRYSHLKMLTAVGMVMGIHAFVEIVFGGVELSFKTFTAYLPVSMLYIASMAVGYLGLRFIELSISSPICNSSGALVAVLTLITGGVENTLKPLAAAAVTLVCAGVIGLGLTEASEDDELRRARQDAGNYRYAKSMLAIAIPIIYCLLDALGTFADTRVLTIIDEDSANTAYELTFFAVGLMCLIYTVLVKKESIVPKKESLRYTGALFETIGQFFYIYALSDTGHVVYSAPIISSYCVASVLWGRIFLKERLSVKHYLCIAAVSVGVIMLGVMDL